MRDDQLQPILDRLENHYRAPVLPLSRILDALRTWLDCVWRLHADPALDCQVRPEYGASYWGFARQIADDLEHSDLLHRMLVEGEPLRTEICPAHRGRRNADARDCVHGCDGTGWLAEPDGEPVVAYDEQTEAGALRRLLRDHGEAAVPLSAFCAAVGKWMRCVRQLHTDPTLAVGGPDPAYGREYWSLLDMMDTDIRHSNLLARLLYAGEELRTEKCPEHDGHWHGSAMLYGCPHKCDGTGWLRRRPTDRGFRSLQLYRLEETDEGKVGRIWDPDAEEWGSHDIPWLRGEA